MMNILITMCKQTQVLVSNLYNFDVGDMLLIHIFLQIWQVLKLKCTEIVYQALNTC